MGKVINIDAFRGKKELDKEFPKFLGRVESHFKADISASEMMKRVYFTLRYLDGNIRGVGLFGMLDNENKKICKNLWIEWLEDIIRQIKDL